MRMDSGSVLKTYFTVIAEHQRLSSVLRTYKDVHLMRDVNKLHWAVTLTLGGGNDRI